MFYTALDVINSVLFWFSESLLSYKCFGNIHSSEKIFSVTPVKCKFKEEKFIFLRPHQTASFLTLF